MSLADACVVRDAADVGVIQSGEHPRLTLESGKAAWVARELARQDFDSDVAPELRAVRALDAKVQEDARISEP